MIINLVAIFFTITGAVCYQDGSFFGERPYGLINLRPNINIKPIIPQIRTFSLPVPLLSSSIFGKFGNDYTSNYRNNLQKNDYVQQGYTKSGLEKTSNAITIETTKAETIKATPFPPSIVDRTNVEINHPKTTPTSTESTTNMDTTEYTTENLETTTDLEPLNRISSQAVASLLG